MNLNPVPSRTSRAVRLFVDSGLMKITDVHLAEGLRTFLIEPRLEKRVWDWGKTYEEYPIWVIAESSRYDYGIAFSDYGFAPEYPWGLIFLSHSNFDADYCWYATLEAAGGSLQGLKIA